MKITNKKILIVTLLTLVFGVLSASAVNAGLWDMQQGMGATSDEIGVAFNQTSGTPTDFRETIALIIQVFIGFLGVIFFVLFIWAGFKWMTSQGNETTITEAKSQLRSAAIGLVIILMAFAITSFVTRCFYDISTGSGASMWMCKF